MTWGAIGAAAVTVVGGALMAPDAPDTGGTQDAARTQAEIGRQQWDRYKTIHAPLEDQYVKDAQNYNNADRQAKVAGEANAVVNAKFGQARQRLLRTPGLDPSSATATAALADFDLKQAAVGAGAQNAARDRLEDQAWARRTDALSLGKGLPAQASSALGSSATTNMQLAGLSQAQANAQGRSIGNIVSKGFDAWGKSNTANSGAGLDGYTDTSYGVTSGRGFDTSDNMQNYGV